MLTVCARPLHLTGAREAGIEAEYVVWDGRGPRPAAAERTRFLVAGYAECAFAPEALGCLPELDVVQLLSAGYADWLEFLPAGVRLANGRGVHGGSTAELAVAGILALVRALPLYLEQQARGEWAPVCRDEVAGRRAVVVGAGDIGGRIASALELLGAHTVLVGRREREGVAPISSLLGLIEDADIVVLALPHTPETDRLVDGAFLERLPDGRSSQTSPVARSLTPRRSLRI